MPKSGLLVVAALLLLLCALGASCAHPPPPPSVAPAPPRAHAPTESNVLRSDYVGSAACARCHAKETEAWGRSPMHHMTQLPESPAVRTPFDGRAMHFKGDTVALESHDGRRFVRIARGGVPDQLYRVTRVIGGRTREDFAGVRVSSANESDADAKRESEEMVLPVSQLFFAYARAPGGETAGALGPLRYKGYSVLVHERAVARPGPVWSETCLFCHNTVPLLSTMFGVLRGGTRAGYQGETVDTLLPADRKWSWHVKDAPGFARAAGDEIAHLGAPRPEEGAATAAVLADAIATTRSHFGADDVVELGIGCESCHGGSQAHLDGVDVAPNLVPYAPFFETTPPTRAPSPMPKRGDAKAATSPAADSRAQATNRVCARCHQVLFSGYPWTWEGGRRQNGDRSGGSPINSGEGRDFLLGGCASAMSCTACHDPHDARDRRAKDDALATPAGNGVCTRCHAELASEDSLRSHAHHDPRGAGGACVACHLARKNMGLDLRLTRYHRIGSPTDPARVVLDRPLECALCHAGMTTNQLVTTMEKWWKKAYSRDLLARLYGDLDAKNLLATLAHGRPHERAVAAATLGATGDKSFAPVIARELANEYPLVRGFAARALADALGRDCGIDVGTAGIPEIEEKARACFAAAGLAVPAFPQGNGESRGEGDEVPND